MKGARLAAIVAVAIGVAAPAHADDDTDFADQLRTYGIYGPRDYNAWLGKIVCGRLGKDQDANADESANFVFTILPRHRTQTQAWEFLASAMRFYCPDQMPVLETAAAQHS